jgi:hypothetical protein
MKIKMRLSYALIKYIMLFIPSLACPSGQTLQFSKLWTILSYNGRYDKILYLVEPQLRFANVQNAYDQFLYNTGIGTPLNPQLQVWIGQTVSNFSANNAAIEDVVATSTTEYRLWQQMSYFYPSSSSLFFNLRTRIEERYSLEFSPWAIRLRERPTLQIPLTEHQLFYISDEIFFNLKSVAWAPTKTLDQNRFFIGITQVLNQKTQFTITYMNQYITKIIPENNHGMMITINLQA